MADVRDILELEYPKLEVSKDAIMGIRKDVQGSNIKKKKEKIRPEGMAREVFALIYSSDKPIVDLPPLMPSETDKSYKSAKAKLGMKKVRPWQWMAFTNPARIDNATFCHWRRIADKSKPYPFAAFNKKIDILQYTDDEYTENISRLSKVKWSRQETDTLFELCDRFDLRWPVIHDRWPSQLITKSIEDLKSRYYEVTNLLKKTRGLDSKILAYDPEHERRRKEQLNRLYHRTPEQIDEEKELLNELRKIEVRKKERERKTLDLQKLICASDAQTKKNTGTKTYKKKLKFNASDSSQGTTEACSGIKFADIKSSGVSLRSQRMKLPLSVGLKKAKAVEQLLNELGLDLHPIAIEEVCQNFNDLRSDLVLMYDLRTVLLNYVFELQSLKHQYQTLTGKTLEIPESLITTSTPTDQSGSPSRPRPISEVLDSVASPNTPNRKRRAALEQISVLKKMKARS